MSKKKILFINGHMNTGGVEKSLLDILQHTDFNLYDIDLLLTEQLGDYASQLPPQVHVILHSIEGTYGPFLKVFLRCLKSKDWFSLKMRLIFLLTKFIGRKCIMLSRKMLTNNKHYHCVIGFRPGFCTDVAAFAAYADKRITWWHHGEINVNRQTYYESATACDLILVVSNACKCMLANVFPTLANKMIVIPNMLDENAILSKATAFNPYSNNDILHIVSVGRLSPEKRFENAIYAAKELKARGFTFCWHLVGSGIMEDRLRHLVKEANVTDCFIFEGNQVNPYPYMKHADLLVHPSYVESQSIVVLEALVLGIPCVVTKSPGPCEYLENNRNALLTEQNPDDLLDKVATILSDTELRNTIRQHACCPKQFQATNVMKKINQMLEQ